MTTDDWICSLLADKYPADTRWDAREAILAWAKARHLRPTRGRCCWRRLFRVDGCRRDDEHLCLPALRIIDHASLWLKYDRPDRIVIQPYHLDQLPDLLEWAASRGLEVSEPGRWPGWHYPGHVYHIELRRADDA